MMSKRLIFTDAQQPFEIHKILVHTTGRLDNVLAVHLESFSRSRIQMIIRTGGCWVNDAPVSKPGLIVKVGDIVLLNIPKPQPAAIEPQDIPLDVIFEDENIIVINKPAGLVVHPSAGHERGTIVNAALAHAPFLRGINGEMRPGIVHRLDKDTSGVLLIAKNDDCQRWLQSQFKNREIVKRYIALVDGFPQTLQGRIEAPIFRDPHNRKKMAIAPDGKGRFAITEFRVKTKFQRHALLEINILTGRTHQIRVHLAALKIPVVGDRVYGHQNPSVEIERHFLHAQEISIRLLNQKSATTFIAPMPSELEKILINLRT